MRLALAALVALDVVLFVAGVASRPRPTALRPFRSATVAAGVRDAGLRLPPPGCWLLRFADSECGFCSGHYASGWRLLRAAARQDGCSVYSLAPSGYDFAAGDGRRSPDVLVLAVTTRFASEARLGYTPTVEAGVGDNVLWRKVGAFSTAQARAYISALARRGLFRAPGNGG